MRWFNFNCRRCRGFRGWGGYRLDDRRCSRLIGARVALGLIVGVAEGSGAGVAVGSEVGVVVGLEVGVTVDSGVGVPAAVQASNASNNGTASQRRNNLPANWNLPDSVSDAWVIISISDQRHHPSPPVDPRWARAYHPPNLSQLRHVFGLGYP